MRLKYSCVRARARVVQPGDSACLSFRKRRIRIYILDGARRRRAAACLANVFFRSYRIRDYQFSGIATTLVVVVVVVGLARSWLAHPATFVVPR